MKNPSPRFSDDELRAIAFISLSAIESFSVPGASLDEIYPDDLDGDGEDTIVPFALVTALRKIRDTGAWSPDEASDDENSDGGSDDE